MANPKDKGDHDGLLSRMARFVRNPASGWSDTDQVEHDPESGYSRQMLKEMIERKRRNDFVRKREFDMLRKLRRNEAVAGVDLTARPSFFQSSMPSRPDDRASTLKKIDEIEAQMSQQWWKARGGEPGGGPTVSRFSAETRLSELQSTNDMLMSRPAPAMTRPLDLPPEPPVRPSARTAAHVPTAPAPLSGLSLRMPLQPAASNPASELPSTAFSLSKAEALDVAEVTHDSDLEDAAIRFAHGDDSGAESVLLGLLAPGSPREHDDSLWLALLDLYRATGRQDRFEEYARSFASRFSRAVPHWRRIGVSAVAAVMGTAAAKPVAPRVAVQPEVPVDWNCPVRLDRQALASLQAVLARRPQPVRLGWDTLEVVDRDAVEALTRQFTQWSAQSIDLEFLAASHLEAVLAGHTRSGDRSVDAAWWRLRMEALRLLHRPDEFELVALDYCVTYEVSPPTWDPPQARCRALAADGGSLSGGSTLAVGGWDEGLGTAEDMALLPPARAELVGMVVGDASAEIERLDERVAGFGAVQVACGELVRIDFTAASALLNWTAGCVGQGRSVHFTDVHRLVAAFFGVIGLGSHARITLRQD